MSAKAIFVFCAQALFVQSVLSQCTSRAAVTAAPGMAAPALAYGIDAPYGLAAPGIAAPALAYGIDAPYGLAAPGIAAPALAYGIDAPYGLAAPGIAAPALAYGIDAPYGLAAPCGIAAPAVDFTPTSGGLLPVSSASAVAPVGISVASENVYEGPLTVAGELPFVGTVGLEGVLPTAGMGAVNHACGNGINAMVSENTAFAPAYAGAAIAPAAAVAPLGAIAPAAAIAPLGAIAPGIAANGLGYRAGWAGRGCGCAL